MTGDLRFVLSDSVAEAAASAFAAQERRIRALLSEVEVRHRGGSSLPGMLTLGDVDVHVRVEAAAFAVARDALCELYEPFHVDVWHAEWAAFVAPVSQPRVEVALTAIGCLDDFHHGEAWDWIAGEPALRERYNALKRAHEGGSVDAYLAAKRAFFYGLRAE